jgi:hypothetical protein
MAQDKQKVQDLIDDFVVNNVDQINEVATENPVLYDAVIDALNLLSRKFGTIQAVNVPKPAAPQAMLNPLIKLGAQFKDTRPNKLNTFKISEIDFDEDFVTSTDLNDNYLTSDTFVRANDNIKRGIWEPVVESKKITLDPSVVVGAKFRQEAGTIIKIIDIQPNDNSYDGGTITYEREGKLALRNISFVYINTLIKNRDLVLVSQPNPSELNPLVKVGVEFKHGIFIYNIVDIDFSNSVVSIIGGNLQGDYDVTFDWINEKIRSGSWQPVAQPSALKLNAIVDIDEVFEKKNGDIITIIDIDTDKELVEYYSSYNQQNVYIPFNYVNDYIDQEEWVWKPSAQTQTSSAQTQSNTFGALTLNPSVKVGQTYLDLDDDSNFSVLEIDQNKQVVTINWNEDDIEAEIDFEDFNNNLEAATWVLAPDQAQGPTTEAEILEAIEGLELIGDAESKKEIAELKKQLKQLKKKKP